jgi:hypothetical protein
MTTQRKSIDLYERPAYKGPEAAHMLAMPVSTVSAWCFGQREFRALITPADEKQRQRARPVSKRG